MVQRGLPFRAHVLASLSAYVCNVARMQHPNIKVVDMGAAFHASPVREGN